MNEFSLHSDIKKAYSLPRDQFEVKVGNYVVDILRGDLIIEVQTRNFSAIKKKLQVLIKDYKVRLVYPVSEKKWITYIAENQAMGNKRKSPRKGRLTDLFCELVMIPNMIKEDSFSLEVLFIDEEEIRCDDGKGSWRRKGASIRDRKLLRLNDAFLFQNKADYLKILPKGLNRVFTNKELACLAKIPLRTAQQVTYCLRKSDIIRTVDKKGREIRFQIN
jgi:hypothetical protein